MFSFDNVSLLVNRCAIQSVESDSSLPSCLDLIFGIIGIPRNDSRSSHRERITAASKRCIFEIPRLFTARGKGRERERERERSEGRFERAIINIFPRVKLGRRLLSEFVPGVRDKRRNARRRRRIQSRDLGMLYIPPVFRSDFA